MQTTGSMPVVLLALRQSESSSCTVVWVGVCASFLFSASPYGLQLVRQTLTKAHRLKGEIAPWPVAVNLVSPSAHGLNKLLQDGEQIKHLLQCSYIGPHLITGTLLD